MPWSASSCLSLGRWITYPNRVCFLPSRLAKVIKGKCWSFLEGSILASFSFLYRYCSYVIPFSSPWTDVLWALLLCFCFENLETLKEERGRKKPIIDSNIYLIWQNLRETCWDKAGHFFDLPDFLSWKATGVTARYVNYKLDFICSHPFSGVCMYIAFLTDWTCCLYICMGFCILETSWIRLLPPLHMPKHHCSCEAWKVGIQGEDCSLKLGTFVRDVNSPSWNVTVFLSKGTFYMVNKRKIFFSWSLKLRQEICFSRKLILNGWVCYEPVLLFISLYLNHHRV